MNKTREKIAEDRQALQEASDHIGMMRSPRLWPHFGVLPMKRHKDGDVEVGCLRLGFKIINGSAEQHYVWIPHSYFWEKVPADDVRVIMDPDFQAILDDGWVVD